MRSRSNYDDFLLQKRNLEDQLGYEREERVMNTYSLVVLSPALLRETMKKLPYI